MNLPPNINKDDKVILFDGVCKLCNRWSQFIINTDEQHIFILCSVQSKEGQQILQHFDFPTHYFETMLLVEGDQYYEKSDAFFNVVKRLGRPWHWLVIFRYIPKTARDWLYDRIALNRYRLFGKYPTCQLPTEDHLKRYLCEK